MNRNHPRTWAVSMAAAAILLVLAAPAAMAGASHACRAEAAAPAAHACTADAAHACTAPAHACATHAPAAHDCARHATVAVHACDAVPAGHVHGEDGDEDGFRWGLYDADRESFSGSTEGDTHRRLRRALRGGDRDAFWFERDGREWVVTDPALVGRVKAALRPMSELGGEMGRVGGRQGALGARAGRYGAEMGRIGGKQGALAARLATLSLRDDLDDDDLLRERREIRRQMRALEREMEEVRERMESHRGGEMERLGEEMKEMGARMKELGRRLRREVRAVSDEAIRTGKARRFDDRSF